MTRFTVLISLSVLLASQAIAQSDDAAYCKKLADYATRYAGDSSFNGGNRPSIDIMDGIDKCDKGDTAAGIATLERKIRSKGFTPPSR
jgi:hypothetical protein